MRIIWNILRFTWGIASIIAYIILIVVTVYVVCPTMEKINHKLGKEIQNV